MTKHVTKSLSLPEYLLKAADRAADDAVTKTAAYIRRLMVEDPGIARYLAMSNDFSVHTVSFSDVQAMARKKLGRALSSEETEKVSNALEAVDWTKYIEAAIEVAIEPLVK